MSGSSRVGRIGLAAIGLGAAIVSLNAGCTSGSARRDDLAAAPMNLNDPKVAMGRQVFLANCNECHPGGAAGQGPSLNNRRLLFDQAITFQVRHGVGAMPKFSKRRISDEQLDSLIVYLKALHEQRPQLGKNEFLTLRNAIKTPVHRSFQRTMIKAGQASGGRLAAYRQETNMKHGIALMALIGMLFSVPVVQAKKVKVEKVTGKIESISAPDKDGNETVVIMAGGKKAGHSVTLSVTPKTQIMSGTAVASLSSLKVGQRVRILGDAPAVTEIEILTHKPTLPATQPAQ